MNLERCILPKNKPVAFKVDVATEGIATTEATLTSATGATTSIALSTDGSGDLPLTALGLSDPLKGSILHIRLDVALNTVPPADWQRCFDTLVFRIEVPQGNPVSFDCADEDKRQSPSKDVISADKYIKFRLQP